MIKANRKQLDVMLAEIYFKDAGETDWDKFWTTLKKANWHPTTHENGIVQLNNMLEEWRIKQVKGYVHTMTKDNGVYCRMMQNGHTVAESHHESDERIAKALCLLRAHGKEVEFEE